MGKKNNKNGKKPTTHMPFVSVCTPTYNRRPFFTTIFECFKNQDYPMSRIEWIIVDDGTDRVRDFWLLRWDMMIRELIWICLNHTWVVKRYNTCIIILLGCSVNVRGSWKERQSLLQCLHEILYKCPDGREWFSRPWIWKW